MGIYLILEDVSKNLFEEKFVRFAVRWKYADGEYSTISPFSELTIGQMYTDSPGYISALTYTVQDNGTWETTFAKLPKYVQVSCTFIYVGERLPSATQKHFETPWVGDKEYQPGLSSAFLNILKNPFRRGEEKRNDGFGDFLAKIDIPIPDISILSSKDIKNINDNT